jgi:hypothetical protein
MDIVKFDEVESKVLEIRGQKVILDTHVATLYGLETKRINEAVKNNPDKFPEGYIIELTKAEWETLKSKFSTSIKGGKVKLPIRGFEIQAPDQKEKEITAISSGVYLTKTEASATAVGKGECGSEVLI